MTERIELAFGGVPDEAGKDLTGKPKYKEPKIIGWYCPETRPDLLMPIYDERMLPNRPKPANPEPNTAQNET